MLGMGLLIMGVIIYFFSFFGYLVFRANNDCFEELNREGL